MRKKWNKKGQEGYFWLFTIVVLASIYFWVRIHTPEPTSQDCNIMKEIPIYSLGLGTSLQGSFIIGIGGFDKEIYYYYYKEKNGGKILDKSNAEWTTLKEEFGTPALVSFYNDNMKCDDPLSPSFIRVPPNTIKQNYNADLSEI